jgi:hypothetical protein
MTTKPPAEKRLHPIAEVSRMLQMSIPTLEWHEAEGRISFRWSGSKRYVEPTEIDRLIASLPLDKPVS